MNVLRLAALALVIAAAPAAAQDAGLLGIPDRLDRQVPLPEAAPAKPKVAAEPPVDIASIPNHRQTMRDIVIELSAYARGRNPDFAVLARGGADLVVKGAGEARWEALRHPAAAEAGRLAPEGTPQRPYIRALDGIVVDGLYCGQDDQRRQATMASLKPLLDEGRRLLVVDHCDGKTAAQAARQAAADKALLFLAKDPRLQAIPGRPPQENADPYTTLTLARNVGFALRSEPYDTRAEWVLKLAETNHDVLVVAPFHRGAEPLTAADVRRLKQKKLGSRRVILAALPLSSIRDTHFHFKHGWALGDPAFLAAPDPAIPGGFLVDYWDPAWKELLGRSLKGIVELGFDGVMFDGVDGYLRPERPQRLDQLK